MRMKHKFKFTLSDVFVSLMCIIYFIIANICNYYIWIKDYPVQEPTVKVINKKSR